MLIGTSGWVLFVVDTTLSDPLVLAVPNDGADAAKYGPLYTAPQRYGGSRINRPGYHDGKPVLMQFVQPMLWRY